MMRSVRRVAPLLLLYGSAAAAQEEPKIDSRREQVFADPKYQVTGVAVSARGRLFTNYPLWSPVHKYSVVEVLPGGEVKPYPDEAMNAWKPGADGLKNWVSIQASRSRSTRTESCSRQTGNGSISSHSPTTSSTASGRPISATPG